MWPQKRRWGMRSIQNLNRRWVVSLKESCTLSINEAGMASSVHVVVRQAVFDGLLLEVATEYVAWTEVVLSTTDSLQTRKRNRSTQQIACR